MRGIERRIDAGLKPDVTSVASIFVSRWDVAVAGKVPEALKNQLGIAVAKRAYKAYLGLLSSAMDARIQCRGASATLTVGQHRHQGSKSFGRSLRRGPGRGPFTVNTMPDAG